MHQPPYYEGPVWPGFTRLHCSGARRSSNNLAPRLLPSPRKSPEPELFFLLLQDKTVQYSNFGAEAGGGGALPKRPEEHAINEQCMSNGAGAAWIGAAPNTPYTNVCLIIHVLCMDLV